MVKSSINIIFSNYIIIKKAIADKTEVKLIDEQPIDNGKCNWRCDLLPLNIYKALNNYCEHGQSKVSRCYKATHGDNRGTVKNLMY